MDYIEGHTLRHLHTHASRKRSREEKVADKDLKSGGEGGIRTPDRLAPMPHFECGAFDHSATSPGAIWGDSSPAVGASSRRGWRARQGAGPRIPRGPNREKGAKNGAFDG